MLLLGELKGTQDAVVVVPGVVACGVEQNVLAGVVGGDLLHYELHIGGEDILKIKPGVAGGQGEYGLVVCVWVYDGRGNILLTRRAKEKSFAGTWENSGGAAKAGEDSRTAIVRELFEETGIRAEREEFEFLRTTRDKNTFFDHYCLRRETPIEEIKLLPGETDAAQWASFEKVHELIDTKQICHVIAKQFLEEEENLKGKQ